jgi:hypothetical protein
MDMNKPRIIKDYSKLPLEIQEQLKLVYPDGFSQNLIEFSNAKGELVSALPFETDDKKYMIRMSGKMAKRIIALDDDYDSEGSLKDDVQENLSEKYSDFEYLGNEESLI